MCLHLRVQVRLVALKGNNCFHVPCEIGSLLEAVMSIHHESIVGLAKLTSNEWLLLTENRFIDYKP